MNRIDSRLWRVARALAYLGGGLVALCAIEIGILHREPPELLWDSAMVLIGIGVVIGTYLAIKVRFER